MRGRNSRLRLAWLVVVAGLAASAVADSEDAFKKGIAAADLKQWGKAVEHLRAAVAENPQESEERIFLSGVFSRPYLPRFYLGWALFNLGTDHCEEALEQWDASERQGVIKSFKRQHQDLNQARVQCNNLLLPAAITAAEQEIAQAAELERALPGPLADSVLDGERLGAVAQLAESRRRLETGKTAARLSDVREASRLASEAGKLLLAVAARSEQARSDRLTSAATAAEQAIAGAGKAQEDLAKLLNDPGRAVIRDERPELRMPADAVSRLTAARTKLDLSSTPSDADAARVDAEAAMESFEAVLQAAEQAYGAFVERLQQQAARGGSEAQRATAAPDPPPVEPPPSPDAALSTPSVDAEETLAEIRRLQALAEHLLGGIGSEDTVSELLETQKSRLAVLILAARESSADDARSLPVLRDRMSQSLGALQLIAGARSYLAGDADRALAILTVAEPSEARLAAQVHLFAAAARFALYRQGGEVELRQQAAEDIHECLALAPRLTLDPRVFSPLFRDFFELGTELSAARELGSEP